MLGRLGIRAKVMAVLAIPMLAIVLAGAFISVTALQELGNATSAREAARALEAFVPLSGALEQERALSLADGEPEEIEAARGATDAALADVRKVTGKLDLAEFPDALVERFQTTQADYEPAGTLANARQASDRGGVKSVVAANYDTMIQGQIDLIDQLAEYLPNRELAGTVIAMREIAATTDSLIDEVIFGLGVREYLNVNSETASGYANLAAATEAARTRATVAVSRINQGDLSMPLGEPSSLFGAMRALLTSTDKDQVAGIGPGPYAGEVNRQIADLQTLTEQIMATGAAIADEDVATARERAIITIGITAFAGALSLMAALIVSRSIVVPLRRLTSAASDIRERLPRIVEQVATPGASPDVELTPIRVTSRDEVGRLAQAFNSMNSTTVRVAQEQAALRESIAEMFVNVARRDQVLLNRQLSFIDSLERTEEDPNTLANLFRLDHLATRMRRNAESLLVLAGIDSGRRLRDAMPLSDVIRTASSEIEQYDRIELDLQIDPPMLGFNALGAAHLLAELLENATVFSEPETPVVVTTGVSGQYVAVRVRDMGLGMTDAEIEAANAKIASSSAGDALGAQRLGLFVVGRIAQRLGAAVRLAKAQDGTGTETTVLFPATLFAASETNMYGAPSIDPAPEYAQIEAPVVEEVDLAALTDGETSLGLPRRRRGEDEPATSTGAVAASGLPTRGSAAPTAAGLPARPTKTFDEDKIVLPDAPSATLAPDLSAAAGDWAPAALETTTGSGLPSRTRAGTSAWQTPGDDTAAAPAPSSPAARAGLFSGFRGRSAGVDENGVRVPGLAPEDDAPAAPVDNVRAPWMSLAGPNTPVQEPPALQIPGLVEDDEEEWAPVAAEPVAETGVDVPVEPAVAPQLEADEAPVADVDEPAWAPTFPGAEGAALPTREEFDETAAGSAPVPAWESPDAEGWAPTFEPAAEVEHAEPDAAPAWTEAVAEPDAAPAWTEAVAEAAPVAEAWAPVEAFDAPVAEVWAPTFETAAEVEHAEPAGEAQAWTEQPAAESWTEPPAAEWTAEQPAAEWTAEQPAAEVWTAEQPAAEAWVAEQPAVEPWTEQPAAEVWTAEQPAAEAWVAEHQVAEQPAAWTTEQSSDAGAWESAAAVVEPVQESEQPWAVEVPADELEHHEAHAAPVAEPVVEPQAPVAPVRTTAYSGYSGYTGRVAPVEPTQSFDFERTLDEARAWHTGALQIVPEPQAPVAEQVVEPVAEAVAEQAPATEAGQADAWPAPAWETPSWQPPTWESPAWEAQAEPAAEPVVESEPVVAEAVAEVEAVAPEAEEPVALVPLLEAEDDAVAAAPEWAETTPAWGAPAWPQLVEDEPTQMFTPVEAAEAVAAEGEQAAAEQPVDEQPVAEQPVVAAELPAWAPTAAGPAPTFDAVVQPEPAKGARKRRGFFGRRKHDEPAAPVAAVAPVVPDPVRQATPAPEPTRASAWSRPAEPVAAPEPLPSRAPVAEQWTPPVWTAPEPAPVSTPTPAQGWTPPEWAAHAPAGTPAAPVVPQPSLPPSVAPQIGTLDDDVAAMLALRGGIQEQALSELSQLSSYRPKAMSSSERLTKRVPTAVPASTAEPEGTAAPIQRDAEQLRSRLSSFQSGSARGRRAQGTPSNDETSI